MASMYKDICEKEEFLSDMNVDVLSALLCRDDLSAPSENFVFKSVMQWIKYRKEERMDVAAKVIGAVRLGLVDSKDVIDGGTRYCGNEGDSRNKLTCCCRKH